jgi:predicted ATPase
MIKHFYLEHFKSYQKAVLPLAPLTLLIGANASGKSNAIEGLRLLSWMTHGQRLSDILNRLGETDLILRGQLTDLGYENSATFSLGCLLDDANIAPWQHLTITIAHDDQGIFIVDESITAPNATSSLYKVVEPADNRYSHDLKVAYNNFATSGRKPKIVCQNQQAVFTQLTTPARFEYGHIRAQQEIPLVTQTFRRVLEQILFLDPHPNRMRDYSFIMNKTLQGDGSNLSSVLYDLCEEQNQKEAILEFIRSLPEQNIRDISFISTLRNDVMVRLTESFANREHERYAPVLSDGTLRVLAVAAAVLSAPSGSVVVIEEIDNGVHPSRAKMLLENLQKVAQNRQLQVLITTHNPALMDALPLDAIPNVVACYRDPREGDSRLIRISEMSQYPELMAQGPLGTLMTKGVLERYLKSGKTPEEKKEAALKWLKSYQTEAQIK